MMMRPRLASQLLAVLLPLALTAPAFAQSSNDDLRREIESLKQGQKQIRQDLAELKRLLQQRPSAGGSNVAGKVFDLGANPVKGEPSARLALIEFMDFQ